MKKFFMKLVGWTVPWGLAGLLAYASWAGNESLLGIAVAAYWLLILIGLITAFLICAGVHLFCEEKDPDKKRELLGRFSELLRKRGRLRKYTGWLVIILTAALLAFSGWIFTAVVYVLAELFIKLLISATREKYEDAMQPQQD